MLCCMRRCWTPPTSPSATMACRATATRRVVPKAASQPPCCQPVHLLQEHESETTVCEACYRGEKWNGGVRMNTAVSQPFLAASGTMQRNAPDAFKQTQQAPRSHTIYYFTSSRASRATGMLTRTITSNHRRMVSAEGGLGQMHAQWLPA